MIKNGRKKSPEVYKVRNDINAKLTGAREEKRKRVQSERTTASDPGKDSGEAREVLSQK